VKAFRASLEKVCTVRAGQKSPRPLRSLAGWLLLVIFFLIYSPVGICAAAILGSLDSTHDARLQSGEHGLQLVLHHGHSCIGHHHGIVARTLTVFAQPATAGNPDHVIQFGSSSSFSNPPPVLQPTLVQGWLPTPAFNEISIALPRPSLATLEAPRPPPHDYGQLTCLRSTVFLI